MKNKKGERNSHGNFSHLLVKYLSETEDSHFNKHDHPQLFPYDQFLSYQLLAKRKQCKQEQMEQVDLHKTLPLM